MKIKYPCVEQISYNSATVYAKLARFRESHPALALTRNQRPQNVIPNHKIPYLSPKIQF